MNPPVFDIQRLQTSDVSIAQAVQTIFASAYVQEAAEIRAALTESPHGRSLDEIMSGVELYFGAHDHGELVGVLTVGPDAEAGQIAITALVVSPQHQRQGVGRALVRQALDSGAGMVFSVIASTNNRPARALYQSLGFVEYRQGSMGEAQLPMVKLRRRADHHAGLHGAGGHNG